ncbi:hypothetical protein MPL3356_90124 [Mesorhizobium plurifarium]|uniref:Uncharacterized protein n=1 Tax=Mesorhizobium plurifarium TaxID=69974 RepID=A0A090EF35_MESPL|nr:hypothetical protein MPL3356_90124 [Mesorhizobium plurifarium]
MACDTKQFGYELLYLWNVPENLETQHHIEFPIIEIQFVAVSKKKLTFGETSSRYVQHFRG